MAKIPKPLSSIQWERRYVSILNEMVDEWKVATRDFLDLLLSQRLNEAANVVISPQYNELKISYSVAANQATAFLPQIYRGIEEVDRKSWERITRSVFGVPLTTYDPESARKFASWVQENTDLIKSLQEDTLKDIRGKVEEGFSSGWSNAKLKRLILQESVIKGEEITASSLRKARKRANLIAVDQAGKLRGRLNQEKQERSGVRAYIWRDDQDARVRGNPSGLYPDATPSHYARRGKRFFWDDAPAGGHPGQAIRCRCYAEPDFSELLGEEPVQEEQPKKKPPKKKNPPLMTSDHQLLKRKDEKIFWGQIFGKNPLVSKEQREVTENYLRDFSREYKFKLAGVGTHNRSSYGSYRRSADPTQAGIITMREDLWEKRNEIYESMMERDSKTVEAMSAWKSLSKKERERQFKLQRGARSQWIKYRWFDREKSYPKSDNKYDAYIGTLAHETGHAIFRQNQLERIWDQNLAKYKVKSQDKMKVSNYSTENNSEFFSEVFRAITFDAGVPDNVKKAFDETVKGVRR